MSRDWPGGVFGFRIGWGARANSLHAEVGAADEEAVNSGRGGDFPDQISPNFPETTTEL